MKKRTGLSLLNKTISVIAIAILFCCFYAVSRGMEVNAESSADIKAGEHLCLGNKNPKGYTGIPYWRVLDKDEEGNLLLMSEYLWKGDGRDKTAVLQFNSDLSQIYWQGSDAQSWCISFENAVLNNVEELTILETTKTDDAFESPDFDPGFIKFFAQENILNKDRVFFLSAEEAARYMPAMQSRVAYLPGSENEDIWWLRSTRDYPNSKCAGRIDDMGGINRYEVNQACTARPAFWAKLDENINSYKRPNGDWVFGDDIGPAKAEDDARAIAAAEAKARKVVTVIVNVKTVNKAALDKVVKKAGGSSKYVTKVVLGAGVKKISKNTFNNYKKVTTLEIKSKKLNKASVKNSLKGTRVKKIKVNVGKKSVNKKYIKKYKSIFTKKNAGRKVSVK